MSDIDKLTFHYIKSPTYDEHALHGVYGGVNSNSQFSMTVFSERMPIPTQIRSTLVPVEGHEGVFTTEGDEVSARDGVIRFVHGTYYFDLAMAKAMIKWLSEKVDAIESQTYDV